MVTPRVAYTVCCVLLSLASVVEAGNLRPYAARHQKATQAATKVAKLPKHPKIATKVAASFQPIGGVAPRVKVAPVAVPAPVVPVTAPAVPMPVDDAMPAVEPVASAKPKAHQPAVVKKLQDDLVEVKQMHTNVMTVEKTLAADVSLLRESALLQKMSSSPKARAAAKEQLRQTERLVKDTEAMVVKSRQNAVARAREALREAHEVQVAADALSAEARAQLSGKSAAVSVEAAKPAAATKPAETDDDTETAEAIADDVAM